MIGRQPVRRVVDVAAAAERRARRRVAEVVEELAPAARSAAGGVALDRAVGLPAAVRRGAAQLRRRGRGRASRPASSTRMPAAGAGRERQRARALGDGERDPVAVVARVELDRRRPPRARAQAGDERPDLLDGHLRLADEPHQPPEVRARREQHRAGGQAVAPGAAGLLVVGLEARRQRPVPDRAHVGLVDAHAEGVRRDDDVGVAAHERVLARASASRPPCRRGRRRPRRPSADEQLGDLLGALARAAVDDRRAGSRPSPGPATSVARLRATEPSPSNGSTSKDRFGRSKPERTRSASRRPRRATISSATFGVAVAVHAITGGWPSSAMTVARRR